MTILQDTDKTSHFTTHPHSFNILPTESIPMFTSDTTDTFTTHALDSEKLIYIFPNLSLLQKHLQLPASVFLLAGAFLPGPMHIMVENQHNPQLPRILIVYIPSLHDETDWFGGKEYLVGTPFSNSHVIAETDVVASNGGDQNYWETTFGIEPTLIDCTDSQKFMIRRPGPISYDEVKQVLHQHHRHISLEVEYLQEKKSFEGAKIYLSDNFQPKGTQTTIILGTKEKLRSVFELSGTEYFHYKQHENFILINLGSQTNAQNVAKNLQNNLKHALRFGIERIILLNQPWGKGPWGEIINYMVHQYTTPVFSNELLNDSQPDTNWVSNPAFAS